jgi:hypothetical protein
MQDCNEVNYPRILPLQNAAVQFQKEGQKDKNELRNKM